MGGRGTQCYDMWGGGVHSVMTCGGRGTQRYDTGGGGIQRYDTGGEGYTAL